MNVSNAEDVIMLVDEDTSSTPNEDIIVAVQNEDTSVATNER